MTAKRQGITAEFLRNVLTYDKNTGVLRWKKKISRKIKVGEIAGSKAGAHWQVGMYGENYLAHHLIWVMMTGDWPTDEVDHEDTDGQNNKWKNLRIATRKQNSANRGKNSNNTSGIKGVSWCKDRQKWQVGIKVNYRRIALGRYDSKEEAGEVYRKAAEKFFGEFSRSD